MQLHLALPWSLSAARRRVVGLRLQVGLGFCGLCFAALAAYDGLQGGASVAARQAWAAVGIAMLLVLLRRDPAFPVRMALYGLASLTACWVIATTASVAGVFPMHSYVALILGSAAALPWGLGSQLVVSGFLLTAALWNASQVPPTALPPNREWAAFLAVVFGSLFLAYFADRDQRVTEAVDRRSRRRDGQRRRHLAELESRVRERTAALAAEVEERRTAQQQVELLMNAMPAYIAYFDAAGLYQWVNDNLCSVLGRTRTLIIGSSIRDAHPGFIWSRVERFATRALAGEEIQAEVDFPMADQTFFVELAFLPHRGRDGRIVGAFMLARDVTARRAEEATRSRTERLASLGTMAAGIAHEINNPAASILAATEMADQLFDGPYDPAEVRAVLRLIGSEAARCGAIVRSVLRYATDQPEPMGLHRIDALIERAATLLRPQAEAAGARLRVEVGAGLPEIPTDPAELVQVVVNLGSNALRAESTEVALVVERRHDCIALCVRDNGRGMTREEAARAFDPFYTTHRSRGGVGLGLSLTHATVLRHGGRIEVQSEPGRGTTMTVALPLVGRRLDA